MKISVESTIAAPIASASKPEQVIDLVASASLTLTPAELDLLNTASAN